MIFPSLLFLPDFKFKGAAAVDGTREIDIASELDGQADVTLSAGDFAVVYMLAAGNMASLPSNPDPEDYAPAGWSVAVNRQNVGDGSPFVSRLFYKRLNDADITGGPIDFFGPTSGPGTINPLRKMLSVLAFGNVRGDPAVDDWAAVSSMADPAAIQVGLSGAKGLIVGGVGVFDGGDVSDFTFTAGGTPAGDGIFSASSNTTRQALKWKIWKSDPEEMTIDYGDSGDKTHVIGAAFSFP